MPNPLSYISPGDILLPSARRHNETIDTINWVKRFRTGAAGRLHVRDHHRETDCVLIENASGTDIAPGEILGIEGPIFDPPGDDASTEAKDNWERKFQFEYALRGIVPARPRHIGRFVVAIDGIKAGRIGRATIAGVTPVKIDIVDESHQWADVIDGDHTKLRSSNMGSARILYAVPGTGEKFALVRIAELPIERPMLGRTVCNGPRGEPDFTDNRFWVRILLIVAPCDPTEPWTLANAPDIIDPCPADGSGSNEGSPGTIPHIVAAFNVGNATSRMHEQPGKLVLLTPLETYADDGSKDGIRWACEFIDPTDNKQNCAQDSSSSGSESGSGSGSEGSGSHPGSCSNPVVQVELKREGNELVQIEHFCDGSTNETRIDLCCDSSSSEGESSEGESSEGSSSGGESSGGGSSGGGSSGGGSSGESSGGSSSGEVQCVECGQCCFSTSATITYDKPTLSASIPATPPYDANLQALYQWAINEFNTSAPSSLPYSSSLSSYYSTPTWGWVGSNTFDFEGNLARLRVVFQPCGGNESPSFNIQIEINGTPTPGARGTMSVGATTWGDTDCCHWVIESAEVWYFSSGAPLIVKEPIGPITFEMEGNECCNDGGDCAEGTADCETGECEE